MSKQNILNLLYSIDIMIKHYGNYNRNINLFKQTKNAFGSSRRNRKLEIKQKSEYKYTLVKIKIVETNIKTS